MPDPTNPQGSASQPNAVPFVGDIDLLLPKDFDQSLWRSLSTNVRYAIAPENLPPLRLTSRPIDVGMLPSDRLSVPWYRTIFTNVGDVLSPENLPPLQLESRPVDVGELIGDQMSHMWWSSLLRNLADNVAPERQPNLQLTSAPFDDPTLTAGFMMLPRWSSVIEGPKIFLPDKPKTAYSVQVAPQPVKLEPAEVEFVQVLRDEMGELKGDLRRSRLRARLWIAFVTAEAGFLIFSMFWR
jgi:hypothetical protein